MEEEKRRVEEEKQRVEEKRRVEEEKRRVEEEKRRMQEEICPVKEWKRKACQKLGHLVPEKTTPPTRKQTLVSFNCFSPDCNYTGKTVTLDAYVKDLKARHDFNIDDKKHSVETRNIYLPRV